ncbi:proline--tRNA ligase [Paenibacillus oralis]|uniref:Proline--tRNA ligase n=1 Tax=Paenibacillus oralis TaxID=2490856 RepID=A0A3P3U808_9BACL|nr:proline--tRNA ligase [Paenibacillus oralis]RRJ66485.1 proline--tRNA ligase [Paenibacillus oralis]
MRQSRLLLPTLREVPAEADSASHAWLLRAGYIRQLAAGVYTYLPLGRRVLRKLEQIVREEMDRAGAQELLLPALQPAELWRESGRYSRYGAELMRLNDRHGREFVLGPTHEEAITSLVKGEVHSYRKLPVSVYQIQTKFRDERRPRFGLLRGREFLMKDAYSFDADWAGLDVSYSLMYQAYRNIMERCQLDYRAVDADSGTIGGEGGSHEFIVFAGIGEDVVAACDHCDYAANIEKASSSHSVNTPPLPGGAALEKMHTPEVHTIEELTQFLQVPPEQLIKTLIYVLDGKQPVAVVVRGDHEVNELKVQAYVGAESIELADPVTVEQATGAPPGFAGPLGLKIPILLDRDVSTLREGIAGANERDYHLRHVSPARDIVTSHIGDFRNVVDGETCPNCQAGKLKLSRGIEVGHIFKLGTKYSQMLGASYLDRNGKQQDIIMGCYGIGISRLLSAVVEQHYDERGIVWPAALAPYRVHIIPVSVKDRQQIELAEQLYEQLARKGIEVLLDDREERPGIKFNDADLIGIPNRIIIGKTAEHGVIEFIKRGKAEVEKITVEEALSRFAPPLQ